MILDEEIDNLLYYKYNIVKLNNDKKLKYKFKNEDDVLFAKDSDNCRFKVVNDYYKGRSCLAEKYIKVGETILIEEPLYRIENDKLK